MPSCDRECAHYAEQYHSPTSAASWGVCEAGQRWAGRVCLPKRGVVITSHKSSECLHPELRNITERVFR